MDSRDWFDALALGVPEIDGDHRIMVELVRTARSAARVGDRNRCGAYLNRLLEFAQDHYRREEAFLRRHAHPDVSNHANCHGALLDRARALKSEIDNGCGVELGQICDDMWTFVIDDITRCDLSLKTFVQNTRLALST